MKNGMEKKSGKMGLVWIQLPLLVRQSIRFAKWLFAKRIDPRVKPAGDDGGWRPCAFFTAPRPI
jgi:hypothetical protein